jgi:hypothetical protein
VLPVRTETYSGFSGTRLVCVSSLRQATPGAPGAGQRGASVTTGLVHPAWRRLGLGGYASDWAGD